MLKIHADAFSEKVDQDMHMLAWLQVNIMNRLRWSKRTPKVSINELLGKHEQSWGSKQEFIEAMKRDEAERERQQMRG